MANTTTDDTCAGTRADAYFGLSASMIAAPLMAAASRCYPAARRPDGGTRPRSEIYCRSGRRKACSCQRLLEIDDAFRFLKAERGMHGMALGVVEQCVRSKFG